VVGGGGRRGEASGVAMARVPTGAGERQRRGGAERGPGGWGSVRSEREKDGVVR
jgi:hypothetical protein